MIYFDYAATTPLDNEAAEVYVKTAVEYFGNSQSLHDSGGQSAALLENCREELAGMMGVDKSGLYFTSGGSESNFLAIEALLSAPKKPGNHILIGMAEHSSIQGTADRLERNGYKITRLPFNSSGLIDLEELSDAITPETILVAIQHVNSEIGTIQPIEAAAEICHSQGIHLHSDFVQSFGKIDSKSTARSVSSFSFSGHKFYGPKGIGGVFINPSIAWRPFFPETSHEKGIRPGTVNVPGIAAMTVAAEKAFQQLDSEQHRILRLRRAFIESLSPVKEHVQLFEATENSQLPEILGMRIKGMEGQWMMLECNRLGFAISTGSACQAGMAAPAKALEAMGLTGREAKEFIRISFGRTTAMEEVLNFGYAIVELVKKDNGFSV